jgi:hypothetical protein
MEQLDVFYRCFGPTALLGRGESLFERFALQTLVAGCLREEWGRLANDPDPANVVSLLSPLVAEALECESETHKLGFPAGVVGFVRRTHIAYIEEQVDHISFSLSRPQVEVLTPLRGAIMAALDEDSGFREALTNLRKQE